VRESVADHSRCPGACRTLERFVGDLAAEEIFCLVESVGDAHDVAAPPLPPSTQADLVSIDNVAFGSLAGIPRCPPYPECGHSPGGLSCPLSANSGPPQLYSITSSARPISVLGMLRPSVFAVLRLMTSSRSGRRSGRPQAGGHRHPHLVQRPGGEGGDRHDSYRQSDRSDGRLNPNLVLRINRGYHDLALIAQHLEGYVVSMPAHHQIEDRSTKTQIA
jgi:hypothetical protein